MLAEKGEQVNMGVECRVSGVELTGVGFVSTLGGEWTRGMSGDRREFR
jgi:hypothetical protein